MTAAIVGPRTLEQLEGQLGAVDVQLSDDVLDAIDEIVPPGTNLNDCRRRLAPAPPRRSGRPAALTDP